MLLVMVTVAVILAAVAGYVLLHIYHKHIRVRIFKKPTLRDESKTPLVPVEQTRLHRDGNEIKFKSNPDGGRTFHI